MSLISFRNFASPFQNRFQIGTIIIVAIVVLAARYSGARVSVEQSGRTETDRVRESGQITPEISKSIDDFFANKHVGVGDSDFSKEVDRLNKVPTAKHEDGDPLLNELLGGNKNTHNSDESANVVTGSHSESKGSSGQLNDIRRSLGLE